MSRSTLVFIFLLSVLTVVLGYNYFVQPFADWFNSDSATDVTDQELDSSNSPEEKALAELSTTEKIWQLMAVPYTVSSMASASANLEQIKSHQPGFVTLFGDQISTTSALTTKQHLTSDSSELPIWLAVDHEGGTVQRLNGQGFTRLPSWQEVCGLAPEQRAIILQKTATELETVGIKVVFAPMVDVASRSAVLGNRVCAATAPEVIDASYQFIDIFNQHHLLAVLKHFPGIGSTKRDLHLAFDQVTVGEADVRIYRELLTQFPLTGVMTAHVGVTNQYPDIPCSLSESCIDELLTNFPQALVFTDALDMKAATLGSGRSPRSLTDVTLDALTAGNNVMVYGRGVPLTELEKVASELETQAATDSGLLHQIDQAVIKIIRYKLNETYE